MDHRVSASYLARASARGDHGAVARLVVDPLRTPAEVALGLAARLRALRLERSWKRDTLAARAGVSAATLKRFERTGEVSLGTLLRLCEALDRLAELDRILEPAAARSMKELEERAVRKVPKRGRL